MITEKAVVLYRGSLKSCNYGCSYCPFSKHRGSGREYDRDRDQWFRFVESLLENGGKAPERSTGAVMVVPYGEALIHDWYWQGLGRLTAGTSLDCAGAQTNLSFSVSRSVDLYREAGGQTGKLSLWATFHPEMTDVETFADQCLRVRREGIRICAGAVGVPENLESIRRLRQLLPRDMYLWINKMDGMERPYTASERQEFEKIDPYFSRELAAVEADESRCRNRFFVESDGRVRRCNISRVLTENWYDRLPGQKSQMRAGCGRKRCSCYLAYGGREDVMNRILFGSYPVFRIPRKMKAVFLDIEGTLIPRGETEISSFAKRDLELLARQGTGLFFATTLPVREARKRCRALWPLFSGGVFAGGAHMVLREEKGEKEVLYPMDRRWLRIMREEGRNRRVRVLAWERRGILYKITLLRPRQLPWKEDEIREVSENCDNRGEGQVRVFAEDCCLQVVPYTASKAEGVKTLCLWLGISLSEAAAAGNSAEDEEMLRITGNPDPFLSDDP